MKWLLLLVSLLLFGAAAYLYGGPARAAQGLQRALAAGDLVALEERVDFPRLREQMKRELHEVVTQAAPDEDSARAVSAFVEPIATALVRPEALAEAAAGKAASGEPRARWTSLSTAQVASSGDESAPRLSLERRGLRWTLVAVELSEQSREQLEAALRERLAARPKASDDERREIGERGVQACLRSQRMAQHSLEALVLAQKSYAAEHGSYTAELAALGFEPVGNPMLYDYGVSLQDGAFVAEAKGKGPMAGDHWQMDEGGLRVVASVCGGPPKGGSSR